ncbi:MAG: aminotransferase class V-fold PLP-dependent enzyme [Candidatus Limivicinus sp.]
MIYLDNAATTMLKPLSVGRAVTQAMQTMASPGRGGHEPTMKAAKTVFDCREEAAALFHVPSPEQIVFTLNATHGLNIAIQSLAGRGSKVLVSGYEHNSVTRPLAALGAEIHVAKAPLFDSAAMLETFEKQLPGMQLVVCTHVSNVFGYILPIEQIARLCREQGVPLIVDASQSAGVLPVDYERLGAAFIAMPGHKGLFGPQGTGLLICAQSGKPLLSGGSGSDSIPQNMPDYLPDRLEAGTHNVCGIAGLREGIRYVRRCGLNSIYAHENSLLQAMISELSGTEGLELFTHGGRNQSGVLSLRSARLNCEEMAALLGEQGVCVRAGLHCAPYAHRTAGTLDSGTVRFSFSPFNSLEDVSHCCQFIKDLL